MHLLTRASFIHWYLFDAVDVEIDGSTALIGPTGSGKSSFQDGVQTVMTGANSNRTHLNPSASGKSTRTILEYCLGLTKDPAEGGKPLRQACESVIALVFRDDETARPLTVGIALSARFGDSREEVLSRFIVPDYAFSVADFKRRSTGGETIAPWSEIAAHMRRMSPDMEEYKSSAEKFTTDMLKRMRGPNRQAPNARHFLRAFSNAMAFKPIFDPTAFVREYVLEPDPLDIERVRTSMETWKTLEALIEETEAKLKRVARLETRFAAWSKSRLRSLEARFVASQAEMRRNTHELASAHKAHVARAGDLHKTTAAIAERRRWIAEFDEEIRTRRVRIDAGSAGALMRHLDNERKFLEREAQVRADRYRKIRMALSGIARLSPIKPILSPRQARAVDCASEALRMLPDAMDPADALHGKGEKLQGLVDEILAAAGLEEMLLEHAERLGGEVREMQVRAERIETMLGQGSSERAVLSPQTSRLVGALQRRGIEPVPLCDVVDMVDESWQQALEGLLGRGREALIVPPAQLQSAFDTMYRDRDQYAGCTLVKTSATPARRIALPKGSILESCRTGDDHAMAFMTVRVGTFLKAENEADLDRLDRGVMRNGKSSSGMGLSVQRDIRDLLFGKAARIRSSESLRNDLAPLLARLNQARGEAQMLREAVRIMGPALDALREGESLFDMEHSARAGRTALKSLAKEMSGGASAEAGDLAEEIKQMEADRAAHIGEIEEEFQPMADALLKEVARAEAKVMAGRDALKRAVLDRARAWAALTAPEARHLVGLNRDAADLDALAVLARVRRDIGDAEFERDDIKGYLTDLRNDNRLIADNADRDAMREQSNAIRELAEYAANWEMDVPKLDGESMAEGYAWVIGERERLEENELRKHQSACVAAAKEMRRMLREDLLARLSEKLTKVHHRLDALNSHLSQHRFTGQTYSFTSTVNGRFGRMYDMAMAMGAGADAGDAAVTEAVEELDDLISGKDAAAMLSDYRQYFAFEIVMTDSQGGRTTMSSRAVKGSGGEAQAPFYVAIAASLASAYFPGHTEGRPTGMGLAMFDEAFNKLDVPNTQALLSFFKDMGLQLMIAGPEDKRATYTEVLDTIVLVNKSLDGTSVYLDAEHPGAKAREALAAINPDHMGVETFRDMAGAR